MSMQYLKKYLKKIYDLIYYFILAHVITTIILINNLQILFSYSCVFFVFIEIVLYGIK